jgi:uncharacterized protein (TIGR02996 family)
MSWEAWGDPPEYPCAVCERNTDDCECPECEVCGSVGDPDCYTRHGLACERPKGEEGAFWAAIRTAPDDQLPRLVFADWLDEHGRDEEAAALRASADRVPRVLNPGVAAAWCLSDLPTDVWEELTPDQPDAGNDQTKWFYNAGRAIQDLCRAWAVVERRRSNPKADFAPRTIIR